MPGPGPPPPPPGPPFLTQHQGGNEGRGHAASTEQEGVRDTEVAVRDPAKDDSCDGRQEAHDRGLHLRRGCLTQESPGAAGFLAGVARALGRPSSRLSAAPGGRLGWTVQSPQAGMMSLFI